MPIIDRITVYPIKSLDGHDLASSRVLANGALLGDRQYALVDGWSKLINGKNCAAIHKIRASYSENLQSVVLSCEDQSASFNLATEQEALAAWCSRVVGTRCRLIENRDGGFPDDDEASGPTLVSTATLQQVTDWFDDLDLPEARRRFRFNLEVANTPAFWEDGLVPEQQCVRRFRIGSIGWQGYGVCRRCVVPTRDSLDGTVTPRFARDFVRQREIHLPDWAPRGRFDTFYRLGINTRIDSVVDSESEAAVICVGDMVTVGDELRG